MMRGGLLGRKLGHSLSPQIHRIFGDYEYKLYEREPDSVAEFVRNGDLDFFNVTIPYKVTVAELCDRLTPMAKRLGNVNFVLRDASGNLLGDNTDAYGVERLLDSVGAKVEGRNCAILGAGGAAMTVKAVLEERGAADVHFVRRGEMPSDDDYLIVNATPVGMYPDVDGTRIDIKYFPNCKVVLDLVYNPSPTRLVREARACGKSAADGMIMLIAQAWRAFRLAQTRGAMGNVGETFNNLYLYGPPASGKSTLCAKLAAATEMIAIDMDAEIERKEKRRISDIFATDGEAAFRAIELDTLSKISVMKGQVISLGGGALLNPECRRIAESTGRVIVLECSEDELIRRASATSERPLLAGDAADRMRKLLANRRDHYASFANRICMGI